MLASEGQSVLSTAGELMETQDLPGTSYQRQAQAIGRLRTRHGVSTERTGASVSGTQVKKSIN